jgi:hypothetical protein
VNALFSRKFISVFSAADVHSVDHGTSIDAVYTGSEVESPPNFIATNFELPMPIPMRTTTLASPTSGAIWRMTKNKTLCNESCGASFVLSPKIELPITKNPSLI